MEIGIIISIAGLALSAATFFIGRVSAGKNTGRETGQVLSDVGYVKRGVDDLREDIKDFREIVENVRITQASQARDIKSAFERIEALERRMSHYHDGGK